jgi:hypothetical protein
MEHYDGKTNASWLNDVWKLHVNDAWIIEADAVSYVCYKCQRSFHDIGVSQMLKGNEVVTVCHVCKEAGLKPQGKTRWTELHHIPEPVSPPAKKQKGAKHGYYDAVLAPLDCECVFCEKLPAWLKREEQGLQPLAQMSLFAEEDVA